MMNQYSTYPLCICCSVRIPIMKPHFITCSYRIKTCMSHKKIVVRIYILHYFLFFWPFGTLFKLYNSEGRERKWLIQFVAFTLAIEKLSLCVLDCMPTQMVTICAGNVNDVLVLLLVPSFCIGLCCGEEVGSFLCRKNQNQIQIYWPSILTHTWIFFFGHF